VHATVTEQLASELSPTDVQRDHARGSVLEQTVHESTRGSAHVKGFGVGDIHLERL